MNDSGPHLSDQLSATFGTAPSDERGSLRLHHRNPEGVLLGSVREVIKHHGKHASARPPTPISLSNGVLAEVVGAQAHHHHLCRLDERRAGHRLTFRRRPRRPDDAAAQMAIDPGQLVQLLQKLHGSRLSGSQVDIHQVLGL